MLAINAASAALMLSGIPFDGPIGAVRVAYTTDGAWIPHPTYEEGDESTFELVVAGRELGRRRRRHHDGRGGRHREGLDATTRPARPRSPRRSSPTGSRRPRPGSRSRSPCSASSSPRPAPASPWRFTPRARLRRRRVGAVEVVGGARAGRGRHHRRQGRAQRRHRRRHRRDRWPSWPAPPTRPARFVGREKEIKEAVRSLTKKLVRKRASSNDGVRIDGRGVERPAAALGRGRRPAHRPRLGPVPAGRDPGAERHHAGHAPHEPAARHASARTPASATCTTTTCRRAPTARPAASARPSAARSATASSPSGPCCPSCPARRSSPTRSGSCPRCCRSNGSTSMASVCASSLSLMDAGVPIKAPVAGIAMGLVFAEGKYTTLTDILGAEDAFGDMDFKVAGTAEFVTALQLDTKIDGIPADVLAAALQQAQEARLDDPRRHERRHRRAARRGRRDGAEDRQLHDPARQDRRGHRAQGQGHQHHPAGDRRRHRRRRRRRGGHGHHRVHRRRPGRRGPPPDRADHQPADGPGRRGLHRPGREHHQVRGVRQHPPGPRRPGAHLQARARASASTGSRTCSTSATRSRCASTTSTRTARSASPRSATTRVRRAAATPGRRPSGPRSTGRRPTTRRRPVSFEDSFDAEAREAFGDLGPTAAAAPSGPRRRRRAPRRRSRVAGYRRRYRSLADAIQTTLANGLRVVTERMPEARSVAVGVWVGVGARDEPAELAGVSHFLEHLLFKGTEDRSARAIADGDRPRGRRHERLHDQGVHRLLHAAAGQRRSTSGSRSWATCCSAPALRDRDVESERQVILEELAMDEDTPDDRVHTLLSGVLFPDHPLGRETAGERADGGRHRRRSDVRAFFERWYRPANLVVSVAGARRPRRRVVAAVETAFAAPRAAASCPDGSPPAGRRRPRSSCSAGAPSRSTWPSAAGACARDDPTASASTWSTTSSAAACRAACSTRSASGGVWPTRCSRRRRRYCDAGALTVYAGTAPAQVDEVLDLVDGELERLRRRRHDRRRAGRGRGLPRRLRTCSAWRTRQPHGPPRRPAHLPRAAPDRRRDGRGVPGRRRAPPSPR